MLALAYFAVPLVGQQQASQQRVAGPRETQFNLELLPESEGMNSNCPLVDYLDGQRPDYNLRLAVQLPILPNSPNARIA